MNAFLMKTPFTLAVFLSVIPLPNAAATRLSAVTNGIYVAVGGWRSHSTTNPNGPVTTEPIRFDDELVWLAFCDTGQVELIYPNHEYSIKVRMWGSDGEAVPKTSLGNTFGSKWDSLDGNIGTRQRTVMGYKNNRQAIVMAWGSFTNNPELGGGKFLPAPMELFRMQKAGVYTLEIQMQMLRIIKGTNQWSRQLIRFSPVRIKVEKPPDAKPGKAPK